MNDWTMDDIRHERDTARCELVAVINERNELRTELERTREALAKLLETGRIVAGYGATVTFGEYQEYEEAQDAAVKVLAPSPQPKGA